MLRKFAIALVAVLMTGCMTIDTYKEQAYDKQTNALANVLKLMDKATTPYSANQDAIDATNIIVEDAYQYDRGRTFNEVTISMWKIIRDPSQRSWAGFLQRWKQNGQFSPTYIKDKKEQIADDFDTIIRLENAKIR